jgi:hypothetical protein
MVEEITISLIGRAHKRKLRDKGASERSRDLKALGLVVGPRQTPHRQESTARGIHQQTLKHVGKVSSDG